MRPLFSVLATVVMALSLAASPPQPAPQVEPSLGLLHQDLELQGLLGQGLSGLAEDQAGTKIRPVQDVDLEVWASHWLLRAGPRAAVTAMLKQNPRS